MFTHLAKYQAGVAANNLAGYERRADYRSVPRVTFTDPETVSLGLTVAGAREQGIEVMKCAVNLGHTSRGEVWGTETTGVLVLVADAQREVLIGAHAAGPLVSELMHEAALAIRAETPLHVLRDVIHAFPTFAESMAYALAALERV
jgi:dihydrolipoamide dehydrogenase